MNLKKLKGFLKCKKNVSVKKTLNKHEKDFHTNSSSKILKDISPEIQKTVPQK